MADRRKPDLSVAVERAKELLAADPNLSKSDACRQASTDTGTQLSRNTFNYRIEHAPPEIQTMDGLNEEINESEIPVFVRDYSHQPKHSIYPVGDLHIGAKEHQEDRLDEWLKYIAKTRYTSILDTGDNFNCAIPGAVSDVHTEKLTVEAARKVGQKKFKPLADLDKIDLLADGNHEWRVYRATGDSPNSAIADALGLNYTRSIAVVRYLVGDQQYEVFFRHGTGGGRRIGSAINNLQDQENVIDADIYVSGHTHTQVAFPKDLFVKGPDGKYVRKKRLFVCSASFLAYEEYAANAGYPPAHIGAPRIFLDGRRHDMHASV
jgi:hypothetical protein